MADTKTQFKLNKLAKDLGLKGKDLMDILSKHGKEVTAQKTLDSSEFDILFDTVTRENQIDDVGAYLDGETYIPSKKKPAKAEKAAEKPAEKAAEEGKAESPVATPATPAAEKKAEPAEKAEKTERRSNACSGDDFNTGKIHSSFCNPPRHTARELSAQAWGSYF